MIEYNLNIANKKKDNNLQKKLAQNQIDANTKNKASILNDRSLLDDHDRDDEYFLHAPQIGGDEYDILDPFAQVYKDMALDVQNDKELNTK